MLRVGVVFFYFFLIILSDSRDSYGNSSLLKCCNHDEVLIRNTDRNNSLECVFDQNKTLQLLITASLNNYSMNFSKNDSCLDVFEDLRTNQRDLVKVEEETLQIRYLNLHRFPKCCPPNSTYDLQERGCIKHKSEDFSLNNKLFLIKTGLSECQSVIADYEIEDFDKNLYNAPTDLFIERLNKKVLFGSFCVDNIYDSEKYVVRVCHPNTDHCRRRSSDKTRMRCIKKCCQDGKMYKGGAKCRYNYERGLSFLNDSKMINSEEPLHLLLGHNCKQYLVPLDWNYTIDELGNIQLLDTHHTFTPFQSGGYCFENVDFGINQGRRLFLCFKKDNSEKVGFKVLRVALILSSIFLILTLIGYMLLPEMQNLHGKTLMCHCFSLLIAFFILAMIQIYPTIATNVCIVIGYLIMYSFMSAFMWSNIMCFDIWWTFGCMKVQGINYKKKEFRRFVWYCLYAWGIPIILTGATYSVQRFGEYIPESLQAIVPDLGGYTCFFEQQSNTTAFLLWFILPVGIIIICNLVLFIRTIMYCYKVKNDIEKIKDTQTHKNERKKILNADTEKLKFASKLFIVMGVSWICEVISACAIPVKPSGIFEIIILVFDTIDCLQGVFIFCIFILKPKFIHALKKKVGVRYLRRTSQSVTTGVMTGSTYVTATPKT